VLVFRDISEEYRAREALAASETRLRELNANLEGEVDDRVRDLRQSEQRFASLFESAPDAVVVANEAGVIQLANQQSMTLFGYGREELLGHRVQELLPGAMDSEPVLPATFPTDRRISALRQDGTRFPVELRLSPRQTTNGRLRIVSIRDVTDRDQLEMQLRQSQRMDTVGRLAGGIAHDFNNLITIVNGTAELAVVELAAGDPMREEFDAIRTAGEKAAALTRQLLAFGRKQILDPTLVDVGVVVQKLEPMFRRLIGAHITIEIRITEDPTIVKIDEGQFEQIVMNLMINSRDAMPDGGTITIATASIHCHQRTREPGPIAFDSECGPALQLPLVEHARHHKRAFKRIQSA
jgi:PAS domain S-box-containing protein